MSADRLVPDVAALRRVPRTTARLARALTILMVVGVGITATAQAATVGQRTALVLATTVAIGGVVAVTTPRRHQGGPAPSNLPWVRSVLVVVLFGAVAVVLLADLGFSARPTVLLLGVVAVTGAYVLPAPYRQGVLLIGVLVWVGVLAAAGVTEPRVLATHAAGAVLLGVVTWRTAAAAEEALVAETTAAQAAGERTALLATVLRLQSLEPDTVERALLEGVRQLGFPVVVLHRVDPDGAVSPALGDDVAADPTLVDPSLATEVVARREGVLTERPTPPGRPPTSVLGLPITVDGDIAAVLVVHHPRRPPSLRRQEALTLLAEEAGRALGRAWQYADDAATVTELRRLDTLTQDFVSTVSHELRTPVTVIEGLGQTLARRWDDLAPERRDDLLGRIDSNADRLATMVRSLMDSSALERGELTAHPEPVALATLVEEVVARLATVTAPRQVTVEVPAELVVAADPGLLRHVLENLLANAAHHTPPDTTVEVLAERQGDDVEVVVRDDGPGIAAEDLPHVLERFYRAGPSSTARPGGLGLGLALAHQIVEAHGRQLTVLSAPGEGTEFRFALSATGAGRPPAGTSSSAS